MKKIIVLLVICLFVPSFSNAYVDLEDSHFAYNDIVELNESNIALGYPDNTFRPDNYITEEELITILLRGANLDVCKSFKNWPNDYIELAVNNGIVVDESLVTGNDFSDFMKKISVLTTINNTFENGLMDKYNALDEINKTTEYITRAEACMWINKLLKDDGKITQKDLPQESEIYYLSNDKLNISTVIKSVEVFDYNTYTGKYVETINLLKNGEHPYLKGRDKKAQGNYIVAIEFDTVNESEYGVWTSYKSLKFEDMQVMDAFDFDEINKQLNNSVYEATLIKPNESHAVTAFYIVNDLPEELVINRDITTLYDLQTHKYVDVNSFSKINIKL